MKNISYSRLFFVLLLGFFATLTVHAQSSTLLKEISNPNAMQWLARSAACNALCISGDCEKSNVCGNFDAFKEAFKNFNINDAIYIKDRKFFLKDTYKKYVLGNTKETRNLKLLDDENDRMLVYLVGKPLMLLKGNEADESPIIRVNSIPISIKDLEKPGDLQLGKVNDEFPDSFEVGIESARYCSKMICDVWSPHFQMSQFKQTISQLMYPIMPMLIDTVSVPTPEPYLVRKTITLKVPFPADKKAFTLNEIKLLLNDLYEAPFKTESMRILTYPSIKGDPIKNKLQQQALANSFIQQFSMTAEGKQVKGLVEYGNIWEHFKKGVHTTNLYYLADSGETYVRKRIETDVNLKNRLTPLLNELCIATIELNVLFDAVQFPEPVYWKYRMKKALNNNNEVVALSYQKHLIRLCESNAIGSNDVIPQGITATPYNLTLFNNQAALMKDDQLQKKQLEELRLVDPNNPLVKYNYFANGLNQVRSYSEDTLRDSMLFYQTEFNTINGSSIPTTLYQILNSRFYYYQVVNRKDRKLLSYRDMAPISKIIPASEALKFSDDFIRIGRYDLACEVLRNHFEDVPESNSDMTIQYCQRLLYYGKYAAFPFSADDYYRFLKRYHDADKSAFKRLFDAHQVSYLLLSEERVRKLYRD